MALDIIPAAEPVSLERSPDVPESGGIAALEKAMEIESIGSAAGVEEPPAETKVEEPPKAEPPKVEDDDDDEPEPAAKAGEPRPISKRQQRINDLIRQAAVAEHERDRLKAELEASKRQPEPEAPTEPQRPDPAKYESGEYDPRYVEDLIAFRTQEAVVQALTRERQRAAQEAAEAGRRHTVAAFEQREAEFAKERADYRQVLEAAKDLPIQDGPEGHTAIRDVILNEPFGPALRYYLAQHPEEVARIVKLPPAPALVALGVLGSSLAARSGAPAPSPTPPSPAAAPLVTSAPTPANPVVAASSGGPRTFSELDTDSHIERYSRERVEGRRR